MPLLTDSGRITIAAAIKVMPVHVAWGLGDGAWVTPPLVNTSETALMAEVGRRIADEVAFVRLDPAGDIVLPSGTYARSLSETSTLLVRVIFNGSDASDVAIREVGVFTGTVLNSGLPVGQRYFTPSQLSKPGRLMVKATNAPIFRSPAVPETFNILLKF